LSSRHYFHERNEWSEIGLDSVWYCPPPVKAKKNAAAVTLAKLRAKSLSPERRAEIAREGAMARLKVVSAGRRREIAKRAAEARWRSRKV